jgi:predicted RNA binding protein YcfA (HicA-like mRNA interferase family)
MQARDTRKAIRDLKQLCKSHGIELVVLSTRGKGSHQGLVFKDPKTGQSVTLTIANHKEISPGVQREVLKYAASLAPRLALGEAVRLILERLFG